MDLDAPMKEKNFESISTYLTYPFYMVYIQLRCLPFYFHYSRLFRIDMDLFFYYFFRYPFHLFQYDCHRSGKPLEELTYGETPYFTIQMVLDKLKISNRDIFVDLGCGKGRSVFFVAEHYGIKSAGIDVISTYITIANTLKNRWNFEQVNFIEKDLLTSKISTASIIWISWTCFSEKTRLKISAYAETFQKGSKVISISYPIDSDHFKAIDCYMGYFSWGKATIYVQEKISNA